MKYSNLKQAYSEKETWITTIIATIIIGGFFYYFSDFELVAGNLGVTHAWVVLISQYILTGLFGLNMGLLSSKLRSASKVKSSTMGTTTIGSILGVIVTGCPACSIGIASYLGLSTFLIALPFFGLELNIIGIGLLGYSTHNLLAKMNTCEIK